MAGPNEYNKFWSGGDAGILVAAADSSHQTKSRAHFICTGVDDDVTIQAAVMALRSAVAGDTDYIMGGNADVTAADRNRAQGGTVYLAAGKYKFSGTVDLSGLSNVHFEGEGPGTVIFNTATDGSHAFTCINSSGEGYENRISFDKFILQGNPASGDGIHVEFTNFVRIGEGMFVQGHGGWGVWIEADNSNAGAQNHVIGGQICYNHTGDLYLEAVHETLIDVAHVEGDATAVPGSIGIRLVGTTDTIIGSAVSIEDHGFSTVVAAATGVDTVNDLFTSAGHILVNGDVVTIAGTLPTGLETNRHYFVVGVSGDDFQISETRGGSAFDLSNTGSGNLTFTCSRGVVATDCFNLAIKTSLIEDTLDIDVRSGARLNLDGSGGAAAVIWSDDTGSVRVRMNGAEFGVLTTYGDIDFFTGSNIRVTKCRLTSSHADADFRFSGLTGPIAALYASLPQDASGSQLYLDNCSIGNSTSTISADIVSIDGGKWMGGAGEVSARLRMIFAPADYSPGASTAALKMTGDGGHLDFEPKVWRATSHTTTITGTSSCFFNIRPGVVRGPNLTLDTCRHIQVGAGWWTTTGTLTIENCDEELSIFANTFDGYHVTINNTSAADQVLQGNNTPGSTLTNNGTGSIVQRLNPGGGTNWTADLT